MGWAARERYEEWRRSHALLSLSGLCSLLLLLRTRSAKNHQVTKYPASHHIRLRSPGTVSLSPLSLALCALPPRTHPSLLRWDKGHVVYLLVVEPSGGTNFHTAPSLPSCTRPNAHPCTSANDNDQVHTKY